MRIPTHIKKDNAVSEIIGFILIFVIVLSLFAGTVAVYVPAKATSAELGYQASTSDTMSQMLSDILNGNLQPNGTGITEHYFYLLQCYNKLDCHLPLNNQSGLQSLYK